MTITSLLASVADQIGQPKGLWEWLLRVMTGIIPTYVFAIIAFTILLKLILSPLDFYQRYKMKKNERITKKLQPEMEKLARQYGDDKATLSQKQFQLQRASGISIFSACIPMLLTMAIFITFFNGMRNISQYEEFSQYVNRYDIYVTRYADLTGLNLDGTSTGISPIEEFDQLIVQWGQGQIELRTQNKEYSQAALDAFDEYNKHANFSAFYNDYLNRAVLRNFIHDNQIIAVYDDHTYTHIDVKSAITNSQGQSAYDTTKLYTFDYDNASAEQKAEFNTAKNRYIAGVKQNLTDFDTQGIIWQIDAIDTFSFDDFIDIYDSLSYYDQLTNTYLRQILAVAEDSAATKVYEDYKQKDPGFLWIKSIWVADVPWADAVPNYATFRSNTQAYMVNNKGGLDDAIFNEVKQAETYQKVMGKVIEDKTLSGANGYLILAILAGGLTFLSQFIMTRQQKRAGTTMTSAGSFKMMMYMMPLMIGAFAIFSTSAFSVYMITNSVVSLLINLVCTFIVKAIYGKEEKEEFNADGIIRYGRKDPNDKK